MDLLVVVFSFVAVIWSFIPIKRYVTTPYRGMPYFNGVLSKKDMEDLIEEEEFENIEKLYEVDWKMTIYNAWREGAYSLTKEYGIEIPDSTTEELLEALAGEKLYSIKSALDKNQSISLMDRGVCFCVKK